MPIFFIYKLFMLLYELKIPYIINIIGTFNSKIASYENHWSVSDFFRLFRLAHNRNIDVEMAIYK